MREMVLTRRARAPRSRLLGEHGRRGADAVAARPSRRERQAQSSRPANIVIIGVTSGQTNVSAYSRGLMGYQTPGRAAFITGQSVFRTGLGKVKLRRRLGPAQGGIAAIAEMLKPLGYATGQSTRPWPTRSSSCTAPAAERCSATSTPSIAEEEPELPTIRKRFLRVPKEVRSAQCDQRLRQPGRHAEDRGRRAADEEADDDRRRHRRPRGGVHREAKQGRQAVLRGGSFTSMRFLVNG